MGDAFTEAAVRAAGLQLLKGIRPREVEDICTWAEHSVDMGRLPTSSATGPLRLYPYQREILRACDSPGCQEVTIMAGQRLGKSQCWGIAGMKRIHDGGCIGLVVYPSLDMGKKNNEDNLRPLLMQLPEIAEDLTRRGNVRADGYHLPGSGSVLYFLGGGAQVISYTANWAVLDECDFVELGGTGEEGKNVSQIKALRLRMQSYERRMLIACSSPSTRAGVIWRAWEKGSQGVWNLRCQDCGKLSPCNRLAHYMDGVKWGGLQWQKDKDGRIVEDSIRWVCPHCGHEHAEEDARALADSGEYVHSFYTNKKHRSFCIGALANPRLWSWLEIAQAQEDAANGGIDEKRYLANTVLGMPYKHVKATEEGELLEKNKSRIADYPPDLAERLSGVFAGVDQQSSELAGRKYFVSVVRGWDEEGNSWLLSSGIDNSLAEVEARLEAVYFGQRVKLAFMDMGGFSVADDLAPYIRAHSRAWFYKGTGTKELDGKPYRRSPTVEKLFLCNALYYQARLLDLMYSPRRAKGYGWWISPDANATYLQQLSNVRPNTRMLKNAAGELYANWAAFNGARRDFFDSEKMALAAMDVACHELAPQAWRFGHVPRFAALERIRELARARRLAKGGAGMLRKNFAGPCAEEPPTGG